MVEFLCIRFTLQLFVLINGAWRSLAARLVWVQEVAGSNPAAPTTLDFDDSRDNPGLIFYKGTNPSYIDLIHRTAETAVEPVPQFHIA